MRVGFLDLSTLAYTAASPRTEPLGGTQSAVCYLAVELSALGHRVTIFNASQSAGSALGVSVVPNHNVDASQRYAEQDVLVVVNSALGEALRERTGAALPLVLWTGHSWDQPAMQRLILGREARCWNQFVFVSNWQKYQFERMYGVMPEKSLVLRNAASPAFLAEAFCEPWYSSGEAPILYYASTPSRGLETLLRAFPSIRAAVPGAILRVYSSMRVYQASEEPANYRRLYELCRSIEGVEYRGSLGQSQLAVELRGVAGLTYPSTFEETSCIAAIEAMAVGATVIATTLGALPETTATFGQLLNPRANPGTLASDYADHTIRVLESELASPGLAAATRRQQIQFVAAQYSWSVRAVEWDRALSALA
jgi:glycosyltransferase involved in cell wall biosynthesis